MEIPEDNFTRTVSGAAAYEQYRASADSYADDRYDDYGPYDAMADAADDAWQELVEEQLDPLVTKATNRVWALAEQIEETGVDQPHPWTWERYLVSILNDEEGGEDALQEVLEEYFREEAEEMAREYTPCCNDYYCPCH